MSEGRIRGSEVEIRVTRGGRIVGSVSAVRNFNFNVKVEGLTDEYLGEKTERKDSVYKGCGGDFEFVPETGDAFDLIDYMVLRAKRDPSVQDDQINIAVRLAFPAGTKRVVISDAVLSAPGISASGRSAYVNSKVTFDAPDYKPL